MFTPSFVPSWDALHPLIIHFPIALLFLVPLFILLSAILSPTKGRPYLVAGLIVLVLGTGSLFLAASTGEAAGELVDRTNAISATLQGHEALASKAKVIFSILLAVLLALVFAPRAMRLSSSRLLSTYLPVIFVGIYAVALSTLVQTAHQGGRLVHEFGVHALLPRSAAPGQQESSETQAAAPHN